MSRRWMRSLLLAVTGCCVLGGAMVVGIGLAALAEEPSPRSPLHGGEGPGATVERQGPLAALPSAPGAHIEKIKALGENQWLKLPAPAPDPKWGLAHSVTWGAKMAFARDLRGGFIYGEDQHGWVHQKTGHYYDDLWFYDTVKGRWEVQSAKGDRGGYYGAFEYVPSRKDYVQCSYSRQADVFRYDPQGRTWKRLPAAGGPNGIDASGCLDTRRDRVYYGGSSDGAKNPAENFFAYDLKTDTWKKLNLAADRWRQVMSSQQAFFHYDAGADRLVAIATPNCPAAERKVYAYDPEADRCEDPRPLPPEVLKDTEGCGASSAFYDPELNAHFCFFSKGCNTAYDSVWVYRYGKAAEKK